MLPIVSLRKCIMVLYGSDTVHPLDFDSMSLRPSRLAQRADRSFALSQQEAPDIRGSNGARHWQPHWSTPVMTPAQTRMLSILNVSLPAPPEPHGRPSLPCVAHKCVKLSSHAWHGHRHLLPGTLHAHAPGLMELNCDHIWNIILIYVRLVIRACIDRNARLE